MEPFGNIGRLGSRTSVSGSHETLWTGLEWRRGRTREGGGTRVSGVRLEAVEKDTTTLTTKRTEETRHP